MMMYVCPRNPCQATAAGCPLCEPHKFNFGPQRNVWPEPNFTTPVIPQGCICPPTSEQTCQNPTCPRKDHSKATAGMRFAGTPISVKYDVGVLVKLVSAGRSGQLEERIGRGAIVKTRPDGKGLFIVEFEDGEQAYVHQDMVERGP